MKLTLTFFFVLMSLKSMAQVVDGKPLVTPSLHIGTTDFKKPITLALRFRIAPEWHLYWKNPGDAGLAPKAQWTLPEGFTVSDLQFPTPHKIATETAVDYGYDDELFLLATLMPPKAPPQTFTLKVDLTWLVCRESCIPGDATIEFNTATLSEKSRAEATSLIERAREKMPESLSKVDAKLESAIARAQGGKSLLTLRFTGENAKKITDFFPEEIPGFVVNYSEIAVANGTVEFALTPTRKEAKLNSIKGLVMLGEKGYEFSSSVKSAELSGGLLGQDFKTGGGESLSIWLALLFAFIGGLILNVMPCVLPVISLKVMGFVEQAGSGSSKSVQHGLMFTLGVLSSFWLLAFVAVMLQQAGEQIGWGFQFQSPMFVLAMSAVMFVFGMNLIGVFEFSAPNVSGGLGQALSRRDALGSLMNGVLATTLATPCTAPFLGSALGFAFSQPPYIIFAIFSMVGLGLSTPYLILAAKPEWLKFIPKPGEWMIRFKQVMGFLLFATVVWLLSVIGAQLGAEGVVATVAFLLGVGVACWAIGAFIDFSSSAPRKAIVWSLAALVTLGSYYLSFEQYLNWRSVEAATLASPKRESKIAWTAFSLAVVEESVAAGKPVFIDFTADWCFTCKVTEQTVLETDDVREKISALGVMPIKADWTNRNDEITQLLKKFGRSGVPLYVVFPAGKLDEPIVLPEVITKEMLIEALEKSSPALSVKK